MTDHYPTAGHPSGVVTFLFTDIEGSTRLWEHHPEAMRLALAQHDDLLRACIESNGGRVFKTMGDAFCAVFQSPRAAVDSVLASQHWLPALALEVEQEVIPLRVRMALHTGRAEERDGDYFGPTLNRLARLLAAGHGGQVLLSQVSQGVVQDNLPEAAALRSLGKHRLKDLGNPESIFQLLHPGLEHDFPPLRTLEEQELRHNLPQQVTSFVGRERQIAEVKTLLDRTRLLTLTGPGGSGKTRLALQVGAELLDRSGDGVWLVELASLSEPESVLQSVAGTLGLKEEYGQSLSVGLVEHLREKQLLLVLDNCEHLLEACARLADTLLRRCPGLLILATSREGLGIAGEVTYIIPSLSVPTRPELETAASLSHYEAVRLFVERAEFHRPDFAVTNQNAAAVASICFHLDGIPLAIELAAARTRSMSVEEINSKLDRRFRLLTGGSRTALPRQQTLRSLIDWSYNLLSELEKGLFCRLAVFSGNWTLEATERVCTYPDLEEYEILDLLTSLTDKSLVGTDLNEGATYYRMLETVREYALERLMNTPDAGSAVRTLHASYFLKFGRERLELLRTAGEGVAFRELEAQGSNLWTAYRWSADQIPLGADLAVLVGSWRHRAGYLQEAVGAIESGLTRLGPARDAYPERYAGLLRERAGLHLDFKQTEQARQCAEVALSLSLAQGDHLEAARSFNVLGQAAMFDEKFEEARQQLGLALESFRASDRPGDVSIVLNNLGLVARRDRSGGAEEQAARLRRGEESLLEALQLRRSLGDRRGLAETLNNLGVLAHEQDHLERAEQYYREALDYSEELRNVLETGLLLANLGEVAQGRGQLETAVRLFAASECYLGEVASPMQSVVTSLLDQAVQLAALSAPSLQAIRSEVRGLHSADRVTYALGS